MLSQHSAMFVGHARVRIAFDKDEELTHDLETLGAIKVSGENEIFDIPMVPFVDGQFKSLVDKHTSKIKAYAELDFV